MGREPPVALAGGIKRRQQAFPLGIQPQAIRAIDDVIQHQIVYRLVAVAIAGTDIKNIPAGDPVRAIVQHV
ncbi:hypothetical protein D3C78_1796350 [compost metagenome]